MNPIFMQNNISQMMGAIKNGQLDAKSEVMRRISSMTPAQKTKLKSALPMLEKIAQSAGLNTNDLNMVIGQLR